jgi:hypothetical protein
MQLQVRLQLEAKLLKYVRKDMIGGAKHLTVSSEYSAPGVFMSTIQSNMWYFMRKHHITEQDVFKVARRLEQQGFFEITSVGGRTYIKPPAPKQEITTSENEEVITRDARTKYVPSTAEINQGLAVARRYVAESNRRKEMEQRRKELEDKQSTNDSDIKEDQDSLEDYLKD